MKIKLKHCDTCSRDQVIWKNHGGKRYCRQCWSAHEGTRPKKPTAGKPISPRSPKRKAAERTYLLRNREFTAAHPICQAHLTGCTTYTTEVHHKAGRVGDLLLDESLWLAVCRSCHAWIELNPLEAKEKGFSINRL